MNKLKHAIRKSNNITQIQDKYSAPSYIPGSCLLVFASARNSSYGRNRKSSVGMTLSESMSFSKEGPSLNRMERGHEITGNCCYWALHQNRLTCTQSSLKRCLNLRRRFALTDPCTGVDCYKRVNQLDNRN